VTKWKTIRVRQELLAAVEKTVEKGEYNSLSEFVSKAIQQRLDQLREGNESKETDLECPIIYERLLCSPHHIWAMVTPDGNIRLGLSDYAQEHLKGITNLHTELVGRNVSRDKPFGLIETWMFTFNLYSPVSGKIIRINKALADDPSRINIDSYNDGWIAEIKPNDMITLEEELRVLMSPIQYKTWAIKQHYIGHPKS
jgi:glycine cleavage system H protein